jgi:YD repeat-containing protein
VNLVTGIKYADDTVNYFWYDALMRRYAMQDSNGVSYFTWDRNAMNLLAERDLAGSVTAYYTHGDVAVEGIGSLVAAKRNQAGASYYQYPVYDHRGTVVRLVDENGTPTAYYEYDAWGNELRDSVVGGISENRFRYQSNYLCLKDSDAKVYLSPTRPLYVPVGRFLGRDPLDGLGGSFSYCHETVTDQVDPRGTRVRHIGWQRLMEKARKMNRQLAKKRNAAELKALEWHMRVIRARQEVAFYREAITKAQKSVTFWDIVSSGAIFKSTIKRRSALGPGAYRLLAKWETELKKAEEEAAGYREIAQEAQAEMAARTRNLVGKEALKTRLVLWHLQGVSPILGMGL